MTQSPLTSRQGRSKYITRSGEKGSESGEKTYVIDTFLRVVGILPIDLRATQQYRPGALAKELTINAIKTVSIHKIPNSLREDLP